MATTKPQSGVETARKVQNEDSCKATPRTKSTQGARTIEPRKDTKKSLDPPGGDITAGSAEAVNTHEASWIERKPVVKPEAKNQEQKDQVLQGKKLSGTKRCKFENQFSNSVSAMFYAEDLRTNIER